MSVNERSKGHGEQNARIGEAYGGGESRDSPAEGERPTGQARLRGSGLVRHSVQPAPAVCIRCQRSDVPHHAAQQVLAHINQRLLRAGRHKQGARGGVHSALRPIAHGGLRKQDWG